MIEVNSLRIGNWVEVKHVHYISHDEHIGYVEVDSISGAGINITSGYEGNIENTYDDNEIFPIPLTPTILKQCGFEERLHEQHDDMWIFQPDLENIEYRVIEFPVGSWVVSKGLFNWNTELATVKYLHSLQNLLYVIGGIELEINL